MTHSHMVGITNILGNSENFVKINHDDVTSGHLTSYTIIRKFSEINADVSKNERKLEK